MIIILKKIPFNTTEIQIENFLETAVKGGLLSKSGYIDNISFLAKKQIETDKIEYHGLVTILPDSIAKRAIKKLNGKMLNGKYIVIAEYKNRSWHNDQRVNPIIKIESDRRKGDRRLKSIEVKPKVKKTFSLEFSSEKRFNKKLNEAGF